MSSGSLCVGCSMHFTIFKRKNRCIRCRLQYCSTCFKKGENLPRRNIKQCLKCHALSSQPFIRSELMLLSVKELKAFLEQRNVSSAGCTEKKDLVDVMIDHQARQQEELEMANQPSAIYEIDTNEPNETHIDRPPINSQASTSSQEQAHAQPHNEPQGLNDFFGGIQINPEIHRLVESVFQFDESGATGLRPPSRHEMQDRNATSHGIPNYQQYAPNDNFTPSCIHPTPVASRSKIALESFKDGSDIRKLSAKELKVLLDDNYVDYKGCVEKEELVQRVVMLWESKKMQQNATTSVNENQGGENEVCKICMDRVIDCVFLECGHLVTCVECGRKLRECPMCRQNIIRIVRVFKS